MTSVKKGILQQSHERARRRRWFRLFLGLFFVFLLTAGFVSLLNLKFLRVTAVTITGQTSINQIDLKNFIIRQLAGHYLGLVPRDSVFFVSKNVLIAEIKNKFPALAQVIIDWPDVNTLAVRVIDREAKTLWCAETKLAKQCYYLSVDGAIYQPAPNFSSLVLLEFNSSASSSKKIGDHVIAPTMLERATAFLDFLKTNLTFWPTRDLQLAAINVLPLNDFNATLVKKSDLAWRGQILFNTGQSADTIIANFNSVLQNKKFVEDWQSADGQLDYLDLRFPGKVFYKFK